MKPDDNRVADQVDQRLEQSVERGQDVHADDIQDKPEDILSQQEMEKVGDGEAPNARSKSGDGSETPTSDAEKHKCQDPNHDLAEEFWEPKPPKVLMEDPNATPLELRSQIQLYATTEFVYASYILIGTDVYTQAALTPARVPRVAVVSR